MLYSEPIGTYSIGWIVVRQQGSVDISNDVIKKYYNTNMTKVHMDNNVL